MVPSQCYLRKTRKWGESERSHDHASTIYDTQGLSPGAHLHHVIGGCTQYLELDRALYNKYL